MDNSPHNNAQMRRYEMSRNLQSYSAIASDIRRPKGEREAALREVRALERELDMWSKPYNG